MKKHGWGLVVNTAKTDSQALQKTTSLWLLNLSFLPGETVQPSLPPHHQQHQLRPAAPLLLPRPKGLLVLRLNVSEPPHDKTYNIACTLCALWWHRTLLLLADSRDSDQTGRIPRLIWVLAGCTCRFVGYSIYQTLLPVCMSDIDMSRGTAKI